MKREKGFMLIVMAIVTFISSICIFGCNQTDVSNINNAKETPALANCKTAYDQAIVAAITDNDPDNDTLEGYVFVSDGYAYQVKDGVLTLMGTAPTATVTGGTYDATATEYATATFTDLSSSITVLKPVTGGSAIAP